MSGPLGSNLMMQPAAGGSSFYNHQIEQSVRWDGANDSMTRTIGTASNNKIGTWSLWIKRSGIGAYLQIAHVYDGGGINFMFYDTDKLYSDVASGSDSGNSDAVRIW